MQRHSSLSREDGGDKDDGAETSGNVEPFARDNVDVATTFWNVKPFPGDGIDKKEEIQELLWILFEAKSEP